MEQDQKEALKQQIEAKIKSTRESIVSFEELTRPVSPDNAIGRLTRMEAISAKSINEAALAKARATLKQLERALARIGDPDFGLCSECDEPIPPARLMILPETGMCVKCAENLNG